MSNISWKLFVVVGLVMGACGGKGAPKEKDALDGDVGLLDAQDAQGDAHLAKPDLVDAADQLVFPDVETPDGKGDAGDGVQDIPVDIWTAQDCQSHADCDGEGMCVEVAPGSGQTVCAPFCVEECPGGWECKSVYVDGPDPVSLCFPPVETLCAVCNQDAQCLYAGALCLKGSGSVGFCGKYCHPEDSPECPEGFECGAALDDEGKNLGFQCQPPEGSCCVAGNLKGCDDENPCTADSCDPSLGCIYTNIDGPCEGPEPCADYKCVNGACLGVPITEDLILDGIDEDCDGLIDEDWALTAKVVAPIFSATGHIFKGGGLSIRGVLSGPPVVGVSSGGDFKVLPVTTKLKKTDNDQ